MSNNFLEDGAFVNKVNVNGEVIVKVGGDVIKPETQGIRIPPFDNKCIELINANFTHIPLMLVALRVRSQTLQGLSVG
jgi:hypothetical protein